jgi:hypothetical protein
VERKNGDRVRKTIGYARFKEAYAVPAGVYRFFCPQPNRFYPMKKLISKNRLPNGGDQESLRKGIEDTVPKTA